MKRTVAEAYDVAAPRSGDRRRSRRLRGQPPVNPEQFDGVLPVDVLQVIAEHADAATYGALSALCRAARDRLLRTPTVLDRALERFARPIGVGQRRVLLLPNGWRHGLCSGAAYYGDSTWTTNFYLGEKHGVEEHYEAGKLVHRQEFAHGIQEGWHANGTRRFLAFWFKGYRYADRQEWTAQGVRVRHTFYQRDLKTGRERTWDASGRIESVNHWRRGELHGRSKVFRANGTLASSSTWVKGKNIGS